MRHCLALLGLLLVSPGWADATLAPHSCYQAQIDACIDATPCKEISGITACLSGVALPQGAVGLNAACWQYQASFTCEDSRSINSCQGLRDQGCGQIGTNCLSTDANGQCVAASFTYSCPDKPPSVTQQTVCDSAFCQGDVSGCFNTSAAPDQDFAQAAVMVEASREAGVYGVNPNSVEIFKGYREECSVKVLGGAVIKSCCNSTGGGAGFTNHALLSTAMSAALGVGGAAVKGTVKSGSQYVYDALYGQTDSSLIDKGLGAMNNWASDLGTGSTFGAYGFSFSFSVDSGFQFVAFDPYTFAAQIAIMMVEEWLACAANEQALAMKKGQNLCVFVGSYCASKVPIINVCVELKQQSCCFNSLLAKIVNRQGRAQLGLPGNQCGGFNETQLKALNFSQMDFSEFIATITPPAPNLTAVTSQVNATVRQKVQNYYQQTP